MTKIYFQKKASICLKKSKEKVRKQKYPHLTMGMLFNVVVFCVCLKAQ